MSESEERHAAHSYRARCHWTGSTAVGYEAYDRAHTVSMPPAPHVFELSADPAFNGDPKLANPEQLLVLAAASCQLLSFLAVASRARVDVLSYADEGEGVMVEDDRPTRVGSILLQPVIRVASGTSEKRVRHLVEVAHRECFIANSLRTEVRVEPTILIDREAP